MGELDSDPRWRRLHAHPWVCPTCSQTHSGLFDLSCDYPAACPQGGPIGPNSVVCTSTHFPSEDFCILDGEHFFARWVLQLPILGTEDALGFGVWSSLSKANFALYVESFVDGQQGSFGPWFGWFSSRLMGYPDT